MHTTRMHGIDAVRVAAMSMVTVVHAISLSGVLDSPSAAAWSLALYLRHLSLACVPLFLMLSGFLQRKKAFSLAYYRSVLPLVLSYVIISALCVIARVLAGETVSIVAAVYSILNYTANGYAWYFEMYLGLFLLIPFLNMIYAGIATQKGKRILLVSFIFLTLLPDTIAGFSPYYDGSGSTVALNIFPDFFKAIYPITFYFLGCYIGEYKPRLVHYQKVLFVLVAPLLPTLLVAWVTHLRGSYAWYVCNGFQTLTVGITAVAVFLALYDLEIRRVVPQKILEAISVCTFEMYLFSYLWDNLCFGVLNVRNFVPLVMVPILVFAGSFISAFVLRYCLRPIDRGIGKIFDSLTRGKVESL